MSTTITAPRTPLPGLTGLRGVGALWVIVYHAQYGMNLPVASAGYLGVDLFFLLSGFVLSHAHPVTRWDGSLYRAFIRARFARIFPMHWVVLVLIALIALTYPRLHTELNNKLRPFDFVTSMVLIQNWGFGKTSPWNGPAWSLSTEWLVSLAFPLFLQGAQRIRRVDAAAFLCAAAIGIFAIFLMLTQNSGPNVLARAGIVRTVCEFAAGCLLYRYYAGGGRATALTHAAAALLIIAGVLVPKLAILAVFGFVALILLAAQRSGPVARVLSSRPMMFLGDISFSVYLLHWILLQVSNRLESALTVQNRFMFLWFCGYMVLVLVLSTITYRFVERPAQRWLRGQRREQETHRSVSSRDQLRESSFPLLPEP